MRAQEIRVTILFLISIFIWHTASYAQLNINTNLTPQQLVNQILVGNGVSAYNISYSGSPLSIGSFSNGNSTNIGIDEGVIISTGIVSNALGPNSAPNKSTNTLGNGDPQLASLVPGFSVHDAAVLEFDFIPRSDTVKLEYVFASDEYPEWVGSVYNDIFGFFISGPNPSGGNFVNYNLATIPGTSLPVTVNNLNNGPFNTGPCTNCTYYQNNTGGLTIEYDGFTTVIKACIVVTPCVPYHLKIAIGDVGDHSYDSGIFLKSNSFNTNVVTTKVTYSNPSFSNAVEGCSDAIVSFKPCRASSFPRTVHYTVAGTAQNGVDYQYIPDSVVIPANADSVIINITALPDSIIESQETILLIVPTSYCSIDTIVINLTDYQPLNASITGPDSVCINQSFNLIGSSSNGITPYNYLWSGGQTTGSITQIGTQDTVYQFVATDKCGFSDTAYHSIRVLGLPQICLSCSSNDICVGDSISIAVMGGSSYNWSPNHAISSLTDSVVWAAPNHSLFYKVVAQNNFGCQNSDSVYINVNPLPQIQWVASTSNLCPNDTAWVKVTGADTFIWQTNPTITVFNNDSALLYPSSTTIYNVIGRSNKGCIDSTTFTINTHTNPTITFTPAAPQICKGQSTQITASGASTYSWSPTTNLSATTGNSVISSATTTTDYEVVGTDNYGCITTDTITVVVNELPNVSVSPYDTTICENSTIQLTASGAATYNWTPSSTLSSSNGAIVSSTPLFTTLYTLIGVDSNGCSDTTTAIVRVSTKPSISPSAQSICPGQPTILSAASAISGVSYIWSTGDSTPSITVNPLSTTTYTVTATDTIGCSGQTNAVVTVNPLPILSISPAAPEICIGDSINIQFNGGQGYSFLPSSGLTTLASNLVKAKPGSTTTYKLTATNNFGCRDTIDFTVKVNSLPNISATPADSLVCFGLPVVLAASGAQTYSWSPSTYLNTTTGSSIISTPTNNVNYIVLGIDSNGCKAKDTVRLKVSPQFSISALPSRICLGDSTRILTTTTTPFSYLWSNGKTASAFYDHPTTSTIYSVTVTDTLGCTRSRSVTVVVDTLPSVNITPSISTICSGNKATLTASGANSYIWSPSSSLSSTTASQVKANPNSTTTYRVIGSNSFNCRDTAYATVNVLPSPNVLVSPSADTICFGDSTQLIASGAATYTWTPNQGLNAVNGSHVIAKPISNKTYKVVGTAINGCTDSATTIIKVNPLPILTTSFDSTDICVGKSALINSSGANSYQWFPSATVNNPASSNVIVTPIATTTYTLIGTTAAGCIDSTTVFVGVHPYPVVSVNPSNAHICPSDTIALIASGADSYLWYPTTGLLSSNNDSVFAKPSNTTNYNVIGTTVYGCSDTASTTVEVSPVISVSASHSAICQNDSVQLIVTSNTSTTTYLWNTSATANSIWVKPNITTTFSVTGTDASGCSMTKTKTIIVHPNPVISLTPANPAICPGDSVTLSATGASIYSWSGSPSLSSFTGSSTKAFPMATSSLRLIGYSAYGCSDTINFQVQVLTPPVVTVSPTNSLICSGQSVSLTASGAINYQWTPSSGLNQTTGGNVVATPSSATQYGVVGFDLNGCRDTAYTYIDVYTSPVINANKSTICPGDSALLSFTTSHQPDSIIWGTGSQSNSIYVSPLANATYHLTVYYPGGCVKNAAKTISLYNDPKVIGTAQAYSICPGDTAKLIGQQCVSYAWSPIGSGLINSAGANVKALPSTNSIYTVVGTSVHGCVSEDTVSIHIYPQNVISASAADTLICKNDTVSLFVSGAITYNWFPAFPLNVSNQAHVIATLADTTRFIVCGTDLNGCKAHDTIQIMVDPGPMVAINPAAPVLCQGDTTTLTASGALTYNWQPNFWISSTTGSQVQIYPNSNLTYQVRGYNINGCYSDANVYVNVRRNPVMFVSSVVDSICNGDSIRIIATGAGGNGTYNWSPSTGLNSTVGDTIWASPLVSTTYQITGISTDGCSKSISSLIKVNPNPIVNINASKATICLNDSLSLTANGASTYQWVPTNGLISAIGQNALVNPSSATLYQVTGTNQFGCSDTGLFNVHVNLLPNVVITTTDSVLCFGDSTILNANGAQIYNWQTSPFFTYVNGNQAHILPTASHQILVEGTDTNGCKSSDSIQIVVNSLPVISVAASATHLCSGDSLAIAATSNMNPTTYIWNTGDSTSFLSKNPTNSYTYSVVGTNQHGCKDFDSIFVQVNPYPALTLSIGDTTICQNDSIIIQAFSTVNPVTFAWSNNSVNSSINISPSNSSSYSIQISDSIGCSDSAEVMVYVQPLPTAIASSSKPHSCFGDTVIFSTLTSSGVYFLWNGISPGQNVALSTHLSKWYKVDVYDTLGCTAADSVYQKVNPLPQLTLTPTSPEICIGDSVTLSVLSSINPVNYLWNTLNSSASITVSPSSTTAYSVVVADSIGCSSSISQTVEVHGLPVISILPSSPEICLGDSVTLIASSTPAPISLIWSTGQQTHKIRVSPSTSTNFVVSITDINNCENKDTSFVEVHSNPTATISPSSSVICLGDTLNLHVSTNHNPHTVAWNNGAITDTIMVIPATTQKYHVMVVDSNHCKAFDTAQVQVKVRPIVNIETNRYSLCTADSLEIKYKGTATHGAIFNWNFDGATVLNGGGLGPYNLRWNTPGFFTVSLTATQNGCTSYPDTLGINVFQTPEVLFSALPTHSCESLLVHFESQTQNIGKWHWNFGNPFESTDTSNIESPSYAYPVEGNYTVSLLVVSKDGCPAYGYQPSMIEVHKNPVADFDGYPNQVSILDPNISFWDFSEGAIHWQYDFGDPGSAPNNESANQYPWHHFTDTGYFFVRQVVTNIHGCTDTAWRKMYVKPFPQVYFPNAFTPNGDGLNDEFIIEGHDFDWTTFDLHIYDRWGKEVFHSEDIYDGWNGKLENSGENCPVGNYVFILKISDKDKNPEVFKGNIMLVK